MASKALAVAPRLMTLADMTPAQIDGIIHLSHKYKHQTERTLPPHSRFGAWKAKAKHTVRPPQSLHNMSIALLFSKRSTRTRVAAETACGLLGGQAIFLGKDDIQLGVNESPRDTARVLGGMCQGIFARVNDHEEIEELARHAPVPVINALSSLWHPTQVLADLQTLSAARSLWRDPAAPGAPALGNLRPLKIAYVGDSANVLHDMLVTYPRLGHTLQVASPPRYRAPAAVWDRVVALGCDGGIRWTADPREAVSDADVVVTDTWVSMGQEAEYAERVQAFRGYQVTEELCRGKAKEDWKFLHCLPRKQHEVDDEVFYGPRSLVFQEADNRKWTIMAVFHSIFGNWTLNYKEDMAAAISAKEAAKTRQ